MIICQHGRDRRHGRESSTRSKNSTMSGRESTARSPRPGRKRTSEMKSPGGRQQRSSVATGKP